MSTTPFNAFLPSVTYTPSANKAERFVTGFQFSYSDPSLNNQGATSSGIWAILNSILMFKSFNFGTIRDPLYDTLEKFQFTPEFYPVQEGSNVQWIIRSPQILINNLNILHRNVAGYMSLFDVSNSPYYGEAATTATLYQTYFNVVNNTNLIGCYTGYGAATKSVGGNGIAHLFVLSDQNTENWQFSRVGVELQILMDYLAYGGIAVLAPTWPSLSNYKITNSILPTFTSEVTQGLPDAEEITTTGYFTGPLDAVVSIDNGGLIERRSSVTGFGITGPNRVAYACQDKTYVNTGVSASIAYGLTGADLVSSFMNPNRRGSFVTAFLHSVNPLLSTLPIIHCGLSGTDLTIAQNTSTGDLSYTDIFRYPGLDGLTGQRPESNAINAGLTNYILTEDNYSGLNRVFCVMGKNVKSYSMTDFDNPINNLIVSKVPAVGDVAGLMAYSKSPGQGGVHAPIIGPVLGGVINGSVEPYQRFDATKNPAAKTLYDRRVNFFDLNNFGSVSNYFLASEWVGATGTARIISDRFSVLNMVRALRYDVESYLTNLLSGGDQVSNETLWSQITTDITNSIITNTYQRYLQETNGYTVVCNTSNGNVVGINRVTVTITIKPKPVSYSYSGTFATSFTLNITVSE